MARSFDGLLADAAAASSDVPGLLAEVREIGALASSHPDAAMMHVRRILEIVVDDLRVRAKLAPSTKPLERYLPGHCVDGLGDSAV